MLRDPAVRSPVMHCYRLSVCLSVSHI